LCSFLIVSERLLCGGISLLRFQESRLRPGKRLHETGHGLDSNVQQWSRRVAGPGLEALSSLGMLPETPGSDTILCSVKMLFSRMGSSAR